MRREVDKKTPAPEIPHSCSRLCLGPLTFHPHAVGHKIRLSEGCRRAERSENSFNGGLVFSRRPVRTSERIRLQVLKQVPQWKGALRVGFTNVPPSGKSQPLPCMAMPNLTETQGHWAIPVHESCCQEGSVLEFWVSAQGYLYVKPQNRRKKKQHIKMDLHQPLWAMIDVYGQTCSIFLLGSEKKELLFTKKSCPAPDPCVRKPCSFNSDYRALSKISDFTPFLDEEVLQANSCVVCMVREADTTLSCGHRSLCLQCTSRILKEFGTCPLCRLKTDTIIDEEVTVF